MVAVHYDSLHGCILATVNVVCRQAVAEAAPSVPIGVFLDRLMQLTEWTDLRVQVAAVEALGQLGRYGVEGFEPALIDRLGGLLRRTSDKKLQETVIATLGWIAGSLSQRAHRETIRDLLTNMFQTQKLPDLQLLIGQALGCVLGGWGADIYRASVDLNLMEAAHKQLASRTDLTLLNGFLSESSAQHRRTASLTSRQATCIWLFEVAKECGKMPPVQAHLAALNEAFISYLSDKDDFTQDTASRGMSLVYEMGDATMRKTLVAALIDTLLEGGRSVTKMTGDSELMGPETSLGVTPSGEQISTYQELCALATEMNQPDLVYRFLQLSRHEATWNTRRGAASGFSIIASLARDQIRPFFPQLVPKLFRYQFDPSSKVADAMRRIWTALVPEPKATVDEFFEPIFRELLEGLNNRLWRVREARCLSMADLIQGRSTAQLASRMDDLWYACFRVLDDIKVRA